MEEEEEEEEEEGREERNCFNLRVGEKKIWGRYFTVALLRFTAGVQRFTAVTVYCFMHELQ